MDCTRCLCLIIFLTISNVAFVQGAEEYNDEDLVKITPDMINQDGDNKMSAAEKYVSFLENNGNVVPNDEEEFDEDSEQPQENELDYESETMNFLLKHYQSQFESMSSRKGKKKLEEHVQEMDFDKDGTVSKDELRQWLIAQAEKGATQEALALEGVQSFDLDKNGKLSWEEIFEDLKKLGNIANDDFKKGIESEKIRFENADKNKDKFLDDLEYTRYATPEYFTEMANYTILSYIADFDHNKDLKISKEEFLRGFDSKNDKEGYEFEERKFEKMDKNKDGFLTQDEVSSVALEFTINSFVNKRVENLFFHADTDGDGKLSKLEIITSYSLFTKGVKEDDENAENRHDEL
eukprot:gene15974-17582_t